MGAFSDAPLDFGNPFQTFQRRSFRLFKLLERSINYRDMEPVAVSEVLPMIGLLARETILDKVILWHSPVLLLEHFEPPRG
jgi:hypothetical protein